MRLSCLITCWVLLINLDSNLRKYRVKTFQSSMIENPIEFEQFRCKQV